MIFTYGLLVTIKQIFSEYIPRIFHKFVFSNIYFFCKEISHVKKILLDVELSIENCYFLMPVSI